MKTAKRKRYEHKITYVIKNKEEIVQNGSITIYGKSEEECIEKFKREKTIECLCSEEEIEIISFV